jgi:hypothetical protein
MGGGIVNLSAAKSLVLRTHLALRRFGWGNASAVLLAMLALAVWLGPLPHVRHELAAQQRTVERARIALLTADKTAAATAPVLSTNEERLAAFYNALGERRYAEQQVKTLFAVAAKTGLALNQAEYRLATDKQGRFHTYQVVLPVKGNYGAIRRFCEQVLLAVPFASLDQMNFKRDAISNSIVEAQMHFTLNLADASPQDASNTVARVAGTSAPTTKAASAPDILALRSREELIGGARVADTSALFVSQSWAPPPPPAPPKQQETEPPPAPTAPPLPFTYVGKKAEEGTWEVYLARGEQTYIVREHSVIDPMYRVESIKPPTLSVTYMPLNEIQVLAIGGVE